MPSTTHYGINLPQPTDSMADVTNGFNNAWGTIANAPKPKAVIAGPANPTSGYQPGDTIYNQAWKSAFICLVNDANWGLLWRPIQAKWSPWVAFPSTAIAGGYVTSPDFNAIYRISNDGVISLGGGIKISSGTIPNGFQGILTAFPVVMGPDKVTQFEVPLHKSGMGTNNGNYYCKAYPNPGTLAFSFDVYNNANGTADADTVFLWPMTWQMAQRTDL